ncbi:MAG: Holliday junction branch migration protein RuvA [Kiritimatiellae bacterium]|jgi:Holliday junction DNA helicase RuvA|nr:Holliday junction branch migration protein RuvA [Kiritimatiellia bacterium]
MAYIVRLKGELIEKSPALVTVECGGVGYALAVPLSTFDRLPPLGEVATLFVHHIVREDDELLFGFHTDRERNFFKTLLTISGIGPKLALSVLSGLTPGELATAIAEGDVRRLSSISGVGKKTAERIIMELKDKVNPLEAVALRGKERGDDVTPAVLRDAILSLVALGNKAEDARTLVQAAYEKNPNATVQDLIRMALRK